jgi:hypothetical protein
MFMKCSRRNLGVSPENGAMRRLPIWIMSLTIPGCSIPRHEKIVFDPLLIRVQGINSGDPPADFASFAPVASE